TAALASPGVVTCEQGLPVQDGEGQLDEVVIGLDRPELTTLRSPPEPLQHAAHHVLAIQERLIDALATDEDVRQGDHPFVRDTDNLAEGLARARVESLRRGALIFPREPGIPHRPRSPWPGLAAIEKGCPTPDSPFRVPATSSGIRARDPGRRAACGN